VAGRAQNLVPVSAITGPVPSGLTNLAEAQAQAVAVEFQTAEFIMAADSLDEFEVKSLDLAMSGTRSWVAQGDAALRLAQDSGALPSCGDNASPS
jgi:hypothetical protein